MTSHESSSAVRDAGHLAVSEEDLSPEKKSLSHKKSKYQVNVVLQKGIEHQRGICLKNEKND